MEETLVIEQIKLGDRKKLADVYKAHRMEFVNWAVANYLCSRDEARDIYQASIIIFYENILSERLTQLNGSVKTYLFSIGKHKILELRRSDQRFDLQKDVQQLDLEDLQDWEREKKESDLQLVERCLQKLGEPCKTMLELYYLHGMGLEELATHLRYKNSDTVKNIKCRCMLKLREMVETEKNNKPVMHKAEK